MDPTTCVRRLDLPQLEQSIQRRALLYDKGGEEHYNLISALHKSMRNSDPDAAVYWVARMLEAGEDPLYVARRLVRFASEDIGNADPQALVVAVAAKEAAHFMGMPEGNTALAQAAIYLATAPKSNAVYVAYSAAAADAQTQAADPVPLHLRNAPTKLMKNLDYGKGYQYAHDDPEGTAAMDCLPASLAGKKYYKPDERGFEKEIKRRLDGWAEIKKQRRGAIAQTAGAWSLEPGPISSQTSAASHSPSRRRRFVLRADGDDVGLAELAWPLAGLAHHRQHLAVQVHLHDLRGVAVDHERALRPDGDAARHAVELHLADERASGREHLDALVLTIGHPQVALRIDCEPVRHLELTRLVPLAAPLARNLPSLSNLSTRASPLAPGVCPCETNTSPLAAIAMSVG